MSTKRIFLDELTKDGFVLIYDINLDAEERRRKRMFAAAAKLEKNGISYSFVYSHFTRENNPVEHTSYSIIAFCRNTKGEKFLDTLALMEIMKDACPWKKTNILCNDVEEHLTFYQEVGGIKSIDNDTPILECLAYCNEYNGMDVEAKYKDVTFGTIKEKDEMPQSEYYIYSKE